MKACQDYIDLILSAVDDTLSEEEMTALQKHLASCEGCRALYETYLNIQTGIDSMKEEPPERLTEAVMASIRNEKEKSSPVYLLKRFRFTAIAAAAAIVILVGARFLPKASSDAPRTAAAVAAEDAAAEAMPEAMLAAAPEAEEAAEAPAEPATAAGTEDVPAEAAEETAELPAPENGNIQEDGDYSFIEAVQEILDEAASEGYEYALYYVEDISISGLKDLLPSSLEIRLSTGTVVYQVPLDDFESVRDQLSVAGIFDDEKYDEDFILIYPAAG